MVPRNAALVVDKVQFLDKVIVFCRCRGPDSALCLEVLLLQPIFKDVDFPVVAQRLFPWSRLLIIEILPVAVHFVVDVHVGSCRGHRCSS